MAIDMNEALSWRGRNMVDNSGSKIGSIDEIYVDEQSGEPEWALVNTGFFGTRSSFVPLAEARPSGDTVTVAFTKDKVKDAPNVDVDAELSPEEEQELCRYYGLDDDTTTDSGTREDYDSMVSGTQPMGTSGLREADTATATTGTASTGPDIDEDRDIASGDTTTGYGVTADDRTGAETETRDRDDTVGRDVSGPTTDDAMTRSEEELRVGTQRRETGRARLRKVVVSENVTQSVPVRHEEVRVEREPVTDANVGEATSGPDLSDEEHEVTLHEEVPVVDKEVRPKERVRLDTDTVTDEEQVTEDVRKEQIDVDDANRRT